MLNFHSERRREGRSVTGYISFALSWCWVHVYSVLLEDFADIELADWIVNRWVNRVTHSEERQSEICPETKYREIIVLERNIWMAIRSHFFVLQCYCGCTVEMNHEQSYDNEENYTTSNHLNIGPRMINYLHDSNLVKWGYCWPIKSLYYC